MMRKSKNAPKYPNLAAEMSRENVSISDICKVTGKGKSTIYLYMNGTGAGDFTINDAFLISEQLSLACQSLTCFRDPRKQKQPQHRKERKCSKKLFKN